MSNASDLQSDGRREGLGADAGASAPAPPLPSLVNKGHNWTRKEWTRQQKRVFQRLSSWLLEHQARKYQLLRVDLTTAVGGDASALRHHLDVLRRRVERKFEYKGIEIFKIETTEGNGVLHMVWAWLGERSFYLPQQWLSENWEEIHGAMVVWVARMGSSRKDAHGVSRYMAAQYLSDQRGALKRMSWSWRRSRVAIARNWEQLKRLCSQTWRDDRRKRWVRQYNVPMKQMLEAWEGLLTCGQAIIDEVLVEVRDRQVVALF